MAKRDRIITYNAIKGLGAVGILFSHMSYLAEGQNPFWRSFYNVFMSKGAVCTTLFVLCSGFFLNYSWKDKRFKDYIIGKLKRLYPLTVLVFLAALLVDILLKGNGVVNETAVGSGQWFFNVCANLCLFKAFVPVESTFYSFHGPSWYVSLLFGFYLIAFPFMKGIRGNNRKRWLGIMGGVAAAAYSTELLICVLAKIHNWPNLWLCYINPWFRIFGEGFAGILLCESMGGITARIKNHSALEWGALALFIGAFLIRNIKANIMLAWIQIIPMAFLLFAFRHGKGSAGWLLARKPFQFLGDISFELYMTHAFVYEGIPIISGFVSGKLADWLIVHAGTRFVITFIACIIVAWIVHVVMNWINKTIVFRDK